MGQRDAFRSIDNLPQPEGWSSWILKCYLMVTATVMSLGAVRLLSHRQSNNIDGFGCTATTSQQFRDNALSAVGDLYSDPTQCASPYEAFVRIRGTKPGLLDSFTTYTENRKWFDKNTGRQACTIATFDRPGEILPSLLTFSTFIQGPDGEEISFDPGYGDETHIQGELKGKGDDYCVVKLRRQCK